MSYLPGLIDGGLRRLLRFLTDKEVESLGRDIGLCEMIDQEDILRAISTLPRYEAVRLFLKVATPTLLLLRQVFDALEVLGVHARTTGCLFVLANPTQPGERTELLFSPQAVGMVATWPVNKDWKPLTTSLKDLKHRWFEFNPVWRRVLKATKPRMEDGRLNVGQSYIQKRPIYRKTYRSDGDAQKVLGYYLSQVEEFLRRVKTIDKDKLPSEIQSIMRDSDKLLAAGTSVCPRRRSWRSRSQTERPSERLLRRFVSLRFVSDFDKFIEDLYLIADLIQGEGLFDLLRLDIWSSRPQLYEVWVMLSILRWLDERGYKIELRKANAKPNEARFKWDLAYSRDSRPCATVFGESPSMPTGHIFYQLYRPSGDMPDISMLKGAEASSEPIWSIDPKHSPRHGYSLADYRRTAEQYRDSFGAKLSLAVECFPRPWSNPTDFGNGAKLIVDCNPSGSGLPLLLSELQTFHPQMDRWLLCIDLSLSFANRRDGALAELRSYLRASGKEHRFVEECVCFAGNAVAISGTKTLLMHGMLKDPGLKDGTSFKPLYEVIASVVTSERVQKVVLVTDGVLDIPLELAKTHLKNDLGVVVEVFM